MAAKRKGQPVHGWLVIDKPAGPTSSAVVNKARWALRAQKAGHAGTLDPMATGLLAVAFGEATKTVAIAQDGLKTYRFTVRWGAQTATDDLEGAVTAASDRRPDEGAIRAALPAFTGEIQQIPPQFSAVKVEGARAYDLAREGVDLELAARPLWVERLALLDMPDPDHAAFELICGKGGYVRAIARDLGAALGCLGHVVALRRLASGGFTLDQAIAFDALDAVRAGEAEAPLLPVEVGLADLPEVSVTAAQAARLRNGNPVPVAAGDLEYGEEAWASLAGRLVALVTWRAGMLHPSRVFNLD